MNELRLLTALAGLLTSTTLLAASPVTPAGAPVVVYQSSDGFDDLKENVELAISGQGMQVTKVLHIGEMLERTAADTGLGPPPYLKAESLEFCSIRISHLMARAHPANMANCPLTISIYQVKGDPGHSYIAYRRPGMLGDGKAAFTALTRLLDGIVQEALE